MRSRSRVCVAILVAASFTGCGGGFSGVGVPATGTTTNQFTESVSASVGSYAILDLTTGKVEVAVTVPGLATDPVYRSSKMVFRSIDVGSGLVGSIGGTFGAQGDEARTTGAMTRYWLAVFEVTQAQWRLVSSGAQPWTTVQPQSLLGVAATGANKDQTPAVEISFTTAGTTLAAAGTRLGHKLALPTPIQWEYACRAGSTGSFSWGESRDDAVVRNYAVVSEVIDGVEGARTVGGRAPNALGFYDMHGNVWEFTNDGVLRGGSWKDTLSQARCANLGPAIDSSTAHLLVGMRPVLTP